MGLHVELLLQALCFPGIRSLGAQAIIRRKISSDLYVMQRRQGIVGWIGAQYAVSKLAVQVVSQLKQESDAGANIR